MPTYRCVHVECDITKQIEARSPDEAASRLLFIYYTGDCDYGADRVEQIGPDLFRATREGSPDYFDISLCTGE